MRRFAAVITTLILLCTQAFAGDYAFFVEGQGGNVTSPGMLYMAAQAKKRLPHASVERYYWWQYAQLVKRIQGLPNGSRIALAGYSLGGNAVTYVAAATKRPIAVVVSLDPSIWSNIYAIGMNVQRLVVYHDKNVFNVIGLAQVPTVPGYPNSRVTVVNTYDPHLLVDLDPRAQKATLDAVVGALK